MKAKGSITVFMALCLSVCILLIGAALESARITLLSNQASRSAESALDSLFAGYDGDLFDEFGVLLLNTEDLPDFKEIDELIKEYMEQELDPKAGRFLVGGNFLRAHVESVRVVSRMPANAMQGELFARSVLDYMKYRTAAKASGSILEELRLLQEGEEARENGQEALREGEHPDLEGEQAGFEEEYRNVTEKGIFGQIKRLREDGFMELIVPTDRILSQKTTSKSGFPSNTYDGGKTGDSGLLADIADNILYGEYVLEHFDNFTDFGGNDTLQYEVEYILAGNGSDRKNLEECVKRLLLMREGMNIAAIWRSASLSAQAEAYAAALIGWTGLLPLVSLVKTAVVGVWAYAESILDVRSLLGGGSVPLMKQDGDWNLSVHEILDLLSGKLKNSGTHGKGLNYSDYLRLLLLAEDEQPKYYWAMDMIQCRLAGYRPRFYLNDCIYAIQIQAFVRARPLFFYPAGITDLLGVSPYLVKVNASRMY